MCGRNSKYAPHPVFLQNIPLVVPFHRMIIAVAKAAKLGSSYWLVYTTDRLSIVRIAI